MTGRPVPAPTAPHRPPPRARPGQWVLLVLGTVLTVLGAGSLVLGLVLAGAAAAQDDGRWLTGGTERHQTVGRALTSPPAQLDTGGAPLPELPFLDPDDQLAAVQVRAGAVDPAQELFLGVAPTADVERYLEGVPRAELGEDTRDDDEQEAPVGERTPERPGEQPFWAVSDQGTGTREVAFELRPGRWSLVVMNADASAPVWVDLQAGARSDLLGPLSTGPLVGGAVALVLGLPLLLLGAAGLGRDADPELTRARPRGRGGPSAPAAPPPGTGPGAARAEAPGRAPYPVALTGHLDRGLSRWLWLVKWLLVVPHVLVLAVLWPALVVTTVAAGLTVLFTGRYPRPWFAFAVGVLRWSWRVGFYAYSALGTDRYPPFTLASAPYPADLAVARPERLSRGLVLVKWWLLAIPHLLVLAVLTGGTGGTTTARDAEGDVVTATGSWSPSLLGLLVLVAAVALLFTGRYREELFALVVGINRWVYRVAAYVLLLRDEYPPFRLDQGPVEPAPPGPATRPAAEPPEPGRAPSPPPPEQGPPPPARSDPGAPPPPWA
ncbi:DUF4389 domain-containing protein [Kocuria flava]|uniref:DUF4389 domain-containing protein n=1 Tax=Kocuria flava TaxID=446860 RepID=UPI002F93F2AA